MSRPTYTPLNASESGWVVRFNASGEQVLDAPLPWAQFADKAALDAARNPKLYEDCLALAGGVLYRSDGAEWVFELEALDFIADLDTGTATFNDVKTAYNNLLTDMRAKGWMLTS